MPLQRNSPDLLTLSEEDKRDYVNSSGANILLDKTETRRFEEENWQYLRRIAISAIAFDGLRRSKLTDRGEKSRSGTARVPLVDP